MTNSIHSLEKNNNNNKNKIEFIHLDTHLLRMLCAKRARKNMNNSNSSNNNAENPCKDCMHDVICSREDARCVNQLFSLSQSHNIWRENK